MRVVHIVNTLEMGGTQKAILALAHSTALSEYDHAILCLSNDSGFLQQDVDSAGIATRVLRDRWPDPRSRRPYRLWEAAARRLSWTFPMRLAWTLKRMQADLVHTHIVSRIDDQAEAVLNRARLPWVWSIRSNHQSRPSAAKRWPRAAALVAGGNACITANSQSVATDFANRVDMAGVGLKIVHTGADMAAFTPAVARDPVWRSQYGIPADAIVFGTAGRLDRVKGHDVLVAASAALQSRGAEEVHCVVAGEGDLRAELSAQIASLGLQGRFHLIGAVRDMAAFYRELDVFVMPSRSEGFGITLVEALASGLPSIATAVGAAPEVLSHGVGTLIPPGDVESLTHAMEAMLKPEVRAQHSRCAPDVARHFSMDQAAERFAEIYEELLLRL